MISLWLRLLNKTSGWHNYLIWEEREARVMTASFQVFIRGNVFDTEVPSQMYLSSHTK